MHGSSGYFVKKIYIYIGVNNRIILNKMLGYLDVLYIKQVVKLTYPIQLLIKNRKLKIKKNKKRKKKKKKKKRRRKRKKKRVKYKLG
jgi:hypothetical protein